MTQQFEYKMPIYNGQKLVNWVNVGQGTSGPKAIESVDAIYWKTINYPRPEQGASLLSISILDNKFT